MKCRAVMPMPPRPGQTEVEGQAYVQQLGHRPSSKEVEKV